MNAVHISTGGTNAWARVEVLAVCGAIGLLAAVSLPGVARPGAPSERATCANNLRMLGRAIHIWSTEHDGRVPWRTPSAEGGTMVLSGSKPAAAWSEFSSLSNEVSSARIFACPRDEDVRPAETIEQLVRADFRAQSISYTVVLDLAPESGRAWLSSDRNLRSEGISACTARVVAEDLRYHPQIGNSPLAWTSGAGHGELGHVLLNDGTVSFMETPELKQTVLTPAFLYNNIGHFIKAR